MIKKFEDFNENKKPENKKPENTSDDILYVETDEGYEKVKEPLEVVQITGVLSEEEAKKIQENHVVHAGASFVENEVKRGQTLYLTALLRKPGLSYAPHQQGVIQCRIVDIFLGLSKLNSIMK